MSKNRRIALSHAVHLALHSAVNADQIVKEAQKFVSFLEELPELSMPEPGIANIAEFGAHYESQLALVANYPVAGMRKKNVQALVDLFEPLPDGEELSITEVLHAGPRYMFDMGIGEKRRGKILEDLHSIADAHEVELSDVEAHVGVYTTMWSNGHEDYLFNGDAEAAALEAEAEDGTPPLSFKDAVRADRVAQQREAEQAEQAEKPHCGCPNHTPFTAEELPGVRIDQLNVHPAAVEWLLSKGVKTVQDLREAGPGVVAELSPHDQRVLGSFALALEDADSAQKAANLRGMPKFNEDGYLGLPIDSFGDIAPGMLADLQSKGVTCLRDLIENPLLIPATMSHGMTDWLKLTSHLMVGLKKELDDRSDISAEHRADLERKIESMGSMLNLAKNMVTDREVEAKLPEHIKNRFVHFGDDRSGSMSGRRLSDLLSGLAKQAHGQPLVIQGDSPEGQALLALLRSRSGDPKATRGIVPIDSEVDPAFAALIDTIFGGKKEPTKH